MPVQVRTWNYYLDDSLQRRGRPEECVHLWIGDWQDPSGNVVLYYLHYDGNRDCRTEELTDLVVTGLYMPAAAARYVQKMLAQPRKIRTRTIVSGLELELLLPPLPERIREIPIQRKPRIPHLRIDPKMKTLDRFAAARDGAERALELL